MQLNIGRMFTRKEDLRELGAHLKLPPHTIQLAINNSPTNLLEAMHAMLDEWRTMMQTDEQAFTEMYRALSAMGRVDVIREVLSSCE